MTKSHTPRCIFVRHGQTEWSKSGQFTSITDLSLTEFGVKQMRATGLNLIGSSKNLNNNFIEIENLKYIITSPRKRALQTRDLLLESISNDEKNSIIYDIDNDIREWDYGDYEGLKTDQIKELRKSRGLNSNDWEIWGNGCENGENYKQITERVDRVINKIRKIHKEALENDECCDIVVVAHGHILRCFAARWVGREINVNPQFVLDAGGVGVLSYQHRNIDEPAICLAGAFVVPAEEEGAGI
ncbi:phosphoglycerate mutase activity protein [[Candida] boidinii]|nr:phosphoglycerate mutase activity protein [[Candida] boidinii]